jgi:hypothetical protein
LDVVNEFELNDGAFFCKGFFFFHTTIQLVEVEKLIEDKELQEVNHELFPYLFHFHKYLFQLEEGQIVNCLFNYYSVLRIFKCSLLSNELKVGEPGPVERNKRPLSIYSINETLPLTKKQNKKMWLRTELNQKKKMTMKAMSRFQTTSSKTLKVS